MFAGTRSRTAQLEHEVALLKKQLTEKDEQLVVMKVALAKKPGGEVYHIVEPVLSSSRAIYAFTDRLPIVRHFLRFGISVADIGVSRLTPFESCRNFDEQLGRMAPYLDEQVISPQIRAWRAGLNAVYGPAYAAARASADPYILAVQPYAEPCYNTLMPCYNTARSIAWPLVDYTIALIKPELVTFEAKLEEIAEEYDEKAGDNLDHLDPELVYANCEQNANKVMDFAIKHKQTWRQRLQT